MNAIYEIGVQNQQDFWAMLYMYVGASLRDICGRRGGQTIRRAVRQMAEDEGAALRDQLLKAGVKTNLESLYAANTECCCDPRFREKILTGTEEVRLWEVYTCPLANLWVDSGKAWLGQIYCEENQRGLVLGFTQDKGQLNLTKKLTVHRTNGCRPDNYCRFSAYYRAANVEDAQREESFTAPGESAGLEKISAPSATERISKKCVQTLYYLTRKAEEDFGTEGLCAVAEGLRALVPPVAEMMRHYAEMTLNFDMADFVSKNLPVKLDASDAAWDIYPGSRAKQLFLSDFAGPLKRELGLR